MAGRPLTPIGELVGLLDGLPVLLRETRRARHLSLKTVADQAGVNISTLHRIEHGHTAYAMHNVVPLLRWIDQPIQLREQDLSIDFFHASTDGVLHGPSGVQITHLPTGLQAGAYGHGSQLENKAAALTELRLRVEESNGQVQPGIPGVHGQPGVAGDPGAEAPTSGLQV